MPTAATPQEGSDPRAAGELAPSTGKDEREVLRTMRALWVSVEELGLPQLVRFYGSGRGRGQKRFPLALVFPSRMVRESMTPL